MTKIPLYLTLLTLLASGSALAGFDLPSSVFTFDELDEAKTAAAEKERPIAFLWSDTGST